MRLTFIQLKQRKVTSLDASIKKKVRRINAIRVIRDPGKPIDTIGVWGSSAFAPTNFHSYLSQHAQRRHLGWNFRVTSESQNNPVETKGVNSAMTQSGRILRKIIWAAPGKGVVVIMNL